MEPLGRAALLGSEDREEANGEDGKSFGSALEGSALEGSELEGKAAGDDRPPGSVAGNGLDSDTCGSVGLLDGKAAGAVKPLGSPLLDGNRFASAKLLALGKVALGRLLGRLEFGRVAAGKFELRDCSSLASSSGLKDSLRGKAVPPRLEIGSSDDLPASDALGADRSGRPPMLGGSANGAEREAESKVESFPRTTGGGGTYSLASLGSWVIPSAVLLANEDCASAGDESAVRASRWASE